jgi:hypothetical protein
MARAADSLSSIEQRLNVPPDDCDAKSQSKTDAFPALTQQEHARSHQGSSGGQNFQSDYGDAENSRSKVHQSGCFLRSPVLATDKANATATPMAPPYANESHFITLPLIALWT